MFSIISYIQSLIKSPCSQGQCQKPAKAVQEFKALIGDVGGTNIRLALISFSSTSKTYKELTLQKYKTTDYPSLQEAVKQFLSTISKEDYPVLARIGLAGMVYNNQCKITNLPDWPLIDGEEFSQLFNIKSFNFYNDFEIASYGILKQSDEDLIQVNNSETRAVGKPMSVLGAGTGLGVAFIGTTQQKNADGSSKTLYTVFPGEGGHVGFTQATQEQQEYYTFLKTKYPTKGDHVDLEYGLVGPAIPYMYEFLKKKYPNLQQMSQVCIEDEINKDLFLEFDNFPRFEVFQYGASKKDKLCQKVVDFFLELYGQAIGDICLSTLSYGGVYLCGSISVSLVEYMLENKDTFMKEYIVNRPASKAIFDKIPIYVVKEKDIGMVGAFALAQQDCESL